jgi:hypothetical protein
MLRTPAVGLMCGCLPTHLSSAWARTLSCRAPLNSSTVYAGTATGTRQYLPWHLCQHRSCDPGKAGKVWSDLEIAQWSGCTVARFRSDTEAAVTSQPQQSAHRRSWNPKTSDRFRSIRHCPLKNLFVLCTILPYVIFARQRKMKARWKGRWYSYEVWFSKITG